MLQTVEHFLKLRPLLRDVREQENGLILACLDYDSKDEDAQGLLTNLHNEGVVSEIRRDGRLVFPPSIGDSGALAMQIDTGKLPGYFETYDSLIKVNPDAAPQEFVVYDKNDALRAGYLAACGMLLFLKTKAEVWDTTEQRFFLVDQQAVEIPLASYSAQQAAKLPAHFSGITRFLDNEHLDADARWAFFRKACLRLLRDWPKEKRLGILWENIGNVFDRAQQDHSLYLERFSFEDLIKNFDEKRLRFVDDLNQILASIQTALIAVPIGFFLIAEKFKTANGWTGQNIVLAAGGIVFFALLLVLTLNQGKTLQGIKYALNDFETEQKKRVTDKSERLQSLLTITWQQYRRVRCLLWIVRCLLVLFSAVIVMALLWCTLPAWQRFVPYSVDSTSATTNEIGKLNIPKPPALPSVQPQTTKP